MHPKANPDLMGHETAERLLWQAWHSNRLAHAWLICGARGIGKMTLACRFSRFILATGLPRPRSGDGRSVTPLLYVSPDHPTFRQIAVGCHSDFRLIERGCDASGQEKTHLLIENIKEVIRFMRLTPATGEWKIVVIDDVETLYSNSGNALLKILEEPEPRALLFLVSHSPGLLLPTIRSRCNLLTLRPLPEGQVRALLERYRPALTSKEIPVLTYLAEGSIGQALVLADNNGVALYLAFLNLLENTPHLYGPSLHDLSDKVARADMRLFTTFGELIRAWLFRVVRYCVTGKLAANIILLPEELRLTSRLMTPLKLDQWVEVWENIGDLFRQTEVLHLDRRQVITSTLYAVVQLVQSSTLLAE